MIFFVVGNIVVVDLVYEEFFSCEFEGLVSCVFINFFGNDLVYGCGFVVFVVIWKEMVGWVVVGWEVEVFYVV